MKHFLIIIVLFVHFDSIAQDKARIKAMEILKDNPIFVSQLRYDENFYEDKEHNVEQEKFEINKINQNLRTAFDKFWKLSDTIIYANNFDFKKLKKANKEAAFFDIVSMGDYADEEGEPFYITAYKLAVPKKINFLSTLIPLSDADTSLLNTLTEVRKIALTITRGNIFNANELGVKIILLSDTEPTSKRSIDYRNKVKEKYKGHYQEVSYNELLNIVLSEDPKYLYVYHSSTYNAEDGTMVSLIY
jgi:hypothetical protein